MCDLPTLRQNVAEKLIMEYINGIQLVYSEVSAAQEKQQEVAENEEDRMKDLQKQLTQVATRKKKWQYMFAEDMINESEFRERKREDDMIENAIKEQIDILKAASIGTNSKAMNLLIDLPELWNELDDADRKEMMQTVFENIMIDCDVKSGLGFSKKGKQLPFRITDVIYN
jgi:site-specific DNA recombinase